MGGCWKHFLIPVFLLINLSTIFFLFLGALTHVTLKDINFFHVIFGQVHFDGWGGEYDQWLWAHSTDVYPVGWCRAVGHRLEGPLQPPRARRPPARQPRPTRRKRRPGTMLTNISCEVAKFYLKENH